LLFPFVKCDRYNYCIILLEWQHQIGVRLFSVLHYLFLWFCSVCNLCPHYFNNIDCLLMLLIKILIFFFFYGKKISFVDGGCVSFTFGFSAHMSLQMRVKFIGFMAVVNTSHHLPRQYSSTTPFYANYMAS